jgi:hypothetical protein
MSEIPEYINPKLWFTLKSQPKLKCFFSHNPHTFYGRVGAWGLEHDGERVPFCVSKYEISSMSSEAEVWLAGYLKGNEPPPLDDDYEELGGEELEEWRLAATLFHETGVWAKNRTCEVCGKKLLASEPVGFKCSKHYDK